MIPMLLPLREEQTSLPTVARSLIQVTNVTEWWIAWAVKQSTDTLHNMMFMSCHAGKREHRHVGGKKASNAKGSSVKATGAQEGSWLGLSLLAQINSLVF